MSPTEIPGRDPHPRRKPARPRPDRRRISRPGRRATGTGVVRQPSERADPPRLPARRGGLHRLRRDRPPGRIPHRHPRPPDRLAEGVGAAGARAVFDPAQARGAILAVRLFVRASRGVAQSGGWGEAPQGESFRRADPGPGRRPSAGLARMRHRNTPSKASGTGRSWRPCSITACAGKSCAH